MKDHTTPRRPLVCLFDSGIGGLNLLSGCVRALPQADYCYYADNFNVPYGSMDGEEIFLRAERFFSMMEERRPSAAVVACNTVTARAIDRLRAKHTFPIAGIQPPVKQAAERGGNFLVLTTRSTYLSPSFRALVKRFERGAVLCPCDGLAEGIERTFPNLNGEELSGILPVGEYRSVVLGCTHYVFLKKLIEKRYGCPVFDGIAGTADHLRTLVGTADHTVDSEGKIEFICGDFQKNRRIFGILKGCEKNIADGNN